MFKKLFNSNKLRIKNKWKKKLKSLNINFKLKIFLVKPATLLNKFII